MEKGIKDEGINKQQKEYINLKNKETKKGSKGNQISNLIPSTLYILFRPYSGLNPCPSLDSHRYNPLRYRRLLLLSIGTGYISKIFINVFFVSLVFAKPYA